MFLPPALMKSQPILRANASIGSALQAPLRGRFLFILRLAWWALALATMALFFMTIPARYSQLVIIGAENSIALQELGLDANIFTLIFGALDGLIFVAYIFVGALIFIRKSDEWIGLFASLTLITAFFALVRPFDALLLVDTSLRVPLLIILAIAVITVTVFVYIFPDGRFEPAWARWIVLALILFSLYGLANRAWLTQPMPWPPEPLSPIVFLGIFGGAVMQLYRYRRISDVYQRDQTKWVVLGVAVGAIGLVTYNIIVPAIAPRVAFPGMPRVLYLLIGAPLFYLTILQLPIALAVSILRYHLWDIEFIITRTVLYAALTAALAGLFTALENLIQDLFVLITGQQSEIATVIATLVVVAAFTPLKDAIQNFLEKRFNDSSDAPARLKKFADLVETRVTPIYPAQIARRLLAEAVASFDAKGGAAFLSSEKESTLLQALGEWDGEAALCMPFQISEEPVRVGWIALDDRKNGEPYTPAEFDLLSKLFVQIERALQEDALDCD